MPPCVGLSCTLCTSEYNRVEQDFILGLLNVASNCLLLNSSFGKKFKILFGASECEAVCGWGVCPVWLEQPKL